MIVGNTVVRKAAARDLADLVHLLAVMHGQTAPKVPTAAEAEILQKILDDTNRYLLVSETAGQVTGTADMIMVPNLSRDGKPWGVVENVVVHPAWRRHGHATLLLQRLANIAVDCGCYKIELTSSSGRREAHALYKQLGFDATVRGFRKYLQETPGTVTAE